MFNHAIITGYKNRLRLLVGGFLCVILLGCLSTAQASDTIKLTSWNMDWLTLRLPSDPALPPNVPARTATDFAALRAYASKLHSDLIAFEEVDGPEAARLIFPPQKYDLFFAPDPIIQQVGLAMRRDAGLHATLNPELTALNIPQEGHHHPLRGGLDITIHHGDTQLRLLILHLKTGCWAQPLTSRKRACRLLYQQFHIIENWILDRQDDGIPFAILGDFNRRLTPTDPLMKILQSDAPLTLTTAGFSSPCLGGRQFIDHILLGNQARHWLLADSLSVMVFPHTPRGTTLSDHCPVSVQLALP